uniref:Transthyretin-like family protein n=1 Tax=Parastrongyloides trichosuri TaxID=131310 RepID=A0A0N4Z827_PARTI
MITKIYLFLLIIISILNIICVACNNPLGRKQSVAVEGYLMCNGQPAENVKVKLYDVDTFTIDDKMGEGRTDSRGYFRISGYASELFRIDPKVNIYHRCIDSVNPLKILCYQKFSIGIPKSYITNGETPFRIFNVGILELAGKSSGQTTDCINKLK